MQTLIGKHIRLRALEPEDLDFLERIENNELFWDVSHTQTPFSRFILKQYLENAHLDIYQTKQLRLVIEITENNKQVGLIDLFDFDPKNLKAGVGIVIDPEFQNNGFAGEALRLVTNYAFTHLKLHQLYADVTADNLKSIKLFTKHGFSKIGVKKDWVLSKNGFKDEILFQLINT